MKKFFDRTKNMSSPRTRGSSDLWIPAFAGMTEVYMDGKEKRIYKRLKMQINMRYQVVSPSSISGDEYLTVARNLSAGGLAFSTDEKLKIGMTLQLVIELPTFDTPINCLSRVMRIEEPAPGGSYLVGVCFLDMTSQDRARLDEFVKRETL